MHAQHAVVGDAVRVPLLSDCNWDRGEQCGERGGQCGMAEAVAEIITGRRWCPAAVSPPQVALSRFGADV